MARLGRALSRTLSRRLSGVVGTGTGAAEEGHSLVLSEQPEELELSRRSISTTEVESPECLPGGRPLWRMQDGRADSADADPKRKSERIREPHAL